MDVATIDHVNLRYPEDRMEEALEFYCGKLGFEPELVGYDEDGEPYVDHTSHFSVRFSDECLVHMTPSEDPEVLNRYTDESRTAFDHFALVIDAPIDGIKADLEEAGVEIRREFEPGGATGVGPAVFIVDPFGYMIELKEDPARREARNDAIWERFRGGEDVEEIAKDVGVSMPVVNRVVNYRTATAE